MQHRVLLYYERRLKFRNYTFFSFLILEQISRVLKLEEAEAAPILACVLRCQCNDVSIIFLRFLYEITQIL